MQYAALITREDDAYVIVFPSCPGCATQVESKSEIEPMAREALTGWIEAMLATGQTPSRPSYRIRKPRGSQLMRITVPTKLSVKLQLRWARLDAHLTQAQLARRVGVSQPQIAQLEHPDSNPTLDTLERIARALGARLDVAISPRHPVH